MSTARDRAIKLLSDALGEDALHAKGVVDAILEAAMEQVRDTEHARAVRAELEKSGPFVDGVLDQKPDGTNVAADLAVDAAREKR